MFVNKVPLWPNRASRHFTYRRIPAGLALEPFQTKKDLFFDINFNSDFCPTIEIFALEFHRVFRQSGDPFRGMSLGVNSLLTKLSIVSIFCSFVSTT